jgi:hypothetical protein
MLEAITAAASTTTSGHLLTPAGPEVLDPAIHGLNLLR